MPRQHDLVRRGAADRNPLRGLDWENIDGAVEEAGGAVIDKITQIRDGLIQWIKETTGIDLSGIAEFGDAIFAAIAEQLNLPAGGDVMQLLQGLVVLNPTDFLGHLADLVDGDIGEGVPAIFGRLQDRLAGLRGDGGLDASKLFGSVPAEIVEGFENLLSLTAFQTWMNRVTSGLGFTPTGAGGNATQADIENALGSIPFGNIVGDLAASRISGVLDAARIPILDAAKIASGVFGVGLIPDLAASKITSGTFSSGLIPGLDASKIISGALSVGLIPGLPASKITSGTFAQSMITNLTADLGNAVSAASSAESLANAAQSAVSAVAEGIFNGWFGSGATGTAAEAQQTIEAIKTMVIAGYTVETITTSQTWNRPAGTITEFYAILIGGGGKGVNGAGKTGNSGTQSAAGGAAGIDGGYIAEEIDPDDIPSSVAVTVGVAATTAGATGQPSSFGSLASSSPGGAGMGSILGYGSTSSKPGSGGVGASASMTGSTAGTFTSATAGQASALGTAGAPGTNSGPATGSGTAGNGTAGGDAPLTGRSKSGGGGGGGGGAAARGNALVTATGGRGGDGGFPGGASGGGGAAVAFGSPATANPGQSGTPAKGIVFLVYKVVQS